MIGSSSTSVRSRRRSWLDRIRTAKGFSETHLIQQNNNPISVSDPNQKNDEAEAEAEMSVSDVLHELLNFGNPNPPIFNKSSRKQSNPTFCPTTSTSLCFNNDDDSDDGDWNLPGFSKTEVTVIDTSYHSWKFDKLLLRKNNVWKVRDINNNNKKKKIVKLKKGNSSIILVKSISASMKNGASLSKSHLGK